MVVRIVSASGVVRSGTALFSPDRTKRSVTVVLEGSRAPEEFYLDAFSGARCVWGQGSDGPDSTWRLHPDDIAAIVAGGGG